MSSPRSLTYQTECIRDAAERPECEAIRSGLEGALRTIEWVNKNQTAIKEVVRLLKEQPEVIEVMKTFPGSTIGVTR